MFRSRHSKEAIANFVRRVEAVTPEGVSPIEDFAKNYQRLTGKEVCRIYGFTDPIQVYELVHLWNIPLKQPKLNGQVKVSKIEKVVATSGDNIDYKRLAQELADIIVEGIQTKEAYDSIRRTINGNK